MEGIQLKRSPVKRKADQEAVNLTLCIICHREIRGKSVYGHENGRSKLLAASQKCKDGLLSSISADNMKYIVYHMECYKTYVLKARRIKEANITEGDGAGCSQSRTHWQRSITPGNYCIICTNKSYKWDSRLYRICENDRADSFLLATRYLNDDVFNRTSTLSDHNSVFAADILYHTDCMSAYLLRFKRSSEKQMPECQKKRQDIERAFANLIQKLDFPNKGYSLSEMCLFINDDLKDPISNKKLKELLINHYGERIMFSYPKERKQSQLVFSSSTETISIVDKIRSTNIIKSAAEILRKECNEYNFQLDDKFCDEQDLQTSLNKYQDTRPKSWDEFFSHLIPGCKKSAELQRKCDTVFQIVFNTMHGGRKKTPLHISTAQAIHETCRSKLLITAFNHLGICVSYDSLQRQDYALACRTVTLGEGHRVPLASVILPNRHIRASMDNFDKEEDTPSGIGGTHDTVLVIFQDNDNMSQIKPTISLTDFPFDKRKKAFDEKLSCQELIICFKPKTRDEISKDFAPCSKELKSEPEEIAAHIDRVWYLARFLREISIPQFGFPEITEVPSWSSFNSLVSTEVLPKTNISYTPILPHPATDINSVYTTMVNFQDAMLQVQQDDGSLWCDEGMYRLAKEIQLWFPNQFKNIFLGLGSFHTCKVLMSCIGLYLDDSGAKETLIETETFGPKIVESVMSGSHYARGVRGFSLFAEAINRLQFIEFFKENADLQKFSDIFKAAKLLQLSCKEYGFDAGKQAEQACYLMETLDKEFETFINKGISKSKLFRYWNTFLNHIFIILRNMIRADREGNWDLHMIAFQKALPLFFAFGKINYARCGSVYLEDCKKLEELHPTIYASFKKGSFVVQHGNRKFSSVGMDQALEQVYNKPAKGHGGIIGLTRQKQAVAQRDIIKHEKVCISQFYRRMCGLQDDDEYTLHHEFSRTLTHSDEESIEGIINFIIERKNPFDLNNAQDKLYNIVTGKHFDEHEENFKLACYEMGERAYKQFKQERFVDKSKKLFDKVPKLNKSDPQQHIKKINTQNETFDALHLIDVARERGYSITQLLCYELVSTSFFLTKDGFLKKTDKASLVQELEKDLKESTFKTLPSSSHTTATLFDFMLIARQTQAAMSKSMGTFGDFAKLIIHRIKTVSLNSSRIDIIFDVYKGDSIKSAERQRRKTTHPINMNIDGVETPLPKDMHAFWASLSNKYQLEQFFTQYLIECNDFSSTPIYLGGLGEDGQTSILLENGTKEDVSALQSDLEEADERLLLHAHHAVARNVERIVIASSDTDVFVCAVYHFFKSFKKEGLSELWVLCGKGTTSRAVPIHKLVEVLDHSVIEILPALHSITGCDTTSKFGTKLTALKHAKLSPQLLQTFGKTDLCEAMMDDAEEFLVGMLSPNFKSGNELRVHQYHQMKRLDLEKLAPPSTSIKLHIKRSFLQCYRWYHVFVDAPTLLPTLYGYIEEDGEVQPQVSIETIPDDFPHPCTCKKCFKNTVCPCRKKEIPCSRFCKCTANCRNIHNK